MFVTKSNRLQRIDGFARLIHRLNVLFETRRRSPDSKLAARVHGHRHRRCQRHPVDAGDKSGSLCSSGADADGARFGSKASVANIDVVTPGREVTTFQC